MISEGSLLGISNASPQSCQIPPAPHSSEIKDFKVESHNMLGCNRNNQVNIYCIIGPHLDVIQVLTINCPCNYYRIECVLC